MEQKQDTGEMIALHWPHLNRPFLDQINAMVGWMKRNLSGNGFLKIPWGGGKPGKPEWFMKIKEPTEEE